MYLDIPIMNPKKRTGTKKVALDGTVSNQALNKWNRNPSLPMTFARNLPQSLCVVRS
jgi:hypothetical protein